MYIYVCMHTCMHVCIDVCMYVCIYICISLNLFVTFDSTQFSHSEIYTKYVITS